MKSIRKTVRFLLMALLVPVLWVMPAWADIMDPCDSTAGPGSYQNLSPADQDYIRWVDPPDEDYLCQQSNRSAASVVYHCDNAREVTVALYSRYGSYGNYSGGELTRGGEELPLWYQSSTGDGYCDGRRMVYDADLRKFVFLEEESRPLGLTRYGLSVYCSEDGRNYTQASVWLASARREGPGTYWYEVYQADLEEGTCYLRLVLTDQSSIEILGREERYQFETTGGLSLASVEIIEEGAGDASWEDSWETESDRNESGGGGTNYSWEGRDSWDSWEGEGDGSFGTGSLPAYQPGEEEGPETLPWGPEEDPTDGGPAFPQEIGDQEEGRKPEAVSGSGGAAGVSQGASSKAQTRQNPSSAQSGREGASDGSEPEPQPSAATGGAAVVLRREVPLWRRVMEPDAMTMMILAVILITIGIRILWESGGSGQSRYEKSRELAEREARYARYASYDDDVRYGYGSARRRRENQRQSRRGPVGRYDGDLEEEWEEEWEEE